MSHGSGEIVAIFTALFTVAIVALLVSKKAQTDKIFRALGSATAQSIGAAVSPVTGGSNG
jgi:uncharacterized membrane protein YjjP (DUF1212 family)